MALTTTTLSAAVAVNDVSIVVASATGFAAGSLIRVDDEVFQVAKNYVGGTTIPVSRGQDGTVTAIHKASANVNVFLASDQPGPVPPTSTQWPAIKTRRILSYSAAGAITLPSAGEDMVAIINGTSGLAMTLASPTKDLDGSLLYIVANGKAAHTVTLTAGWGAGSTTSDVATFSASYTGGCISMACNGVWVLVGNGLFTANTPVGAPTIA